LLSDELMFVCAAELFLLFILSLVNSTWYHWLW